MAGDIFSITAFLLTLRETMEAALIVGILLAYLSKTRNEHMKKDIWVGVGGAIGLSIIGAIIIEIAFGEFEGAMEKIFEGSVMVAAAAVLTSMIIWNFKNAKVIKQHLEEKIHAAITGRDKYALVTLSFIAVFREGIETVLFLAGIRANESAISVLTGSILGISLSILIAAAMFQGSLQLNIRTFFNVTSVILILFAAGLFAQGIHEFQELGWFGSENAVWNVPLWDLSWLLNDKDNNIGALLRALVGYQDKPTLVELVAYVGYWIAIALAYFKINTTTPKLPVKAA